jgi:hypothetical protein
VLKCFVLIDLKLDKLTHQDIGQMDFYVRYFDNEIKDKLDNPTINFLKRIAKALGKELYVEFK